MRMVQLLFLSLLVIALFAHGNAYTFNRKLTVSTKLFVENKSKYLQPLKEKVRVRLTADVKNVGKKGEIVYVGPSMWLNLISQYKYGVRVSDEDYEKALQLEERRKTHAIEIAQQCADDLRAIGKLTVRKKVGAKNQIFGTVNAKTIIGLIKERMPSDFDWESSQTGITALYKNNQGIKGDKVSEIRETGNFIAVVKVHPTLPLVDVPFEVISDSLY